MRGGTTAKAAGGLGVVGAILAGLLKCAGEDAVLAGKAAAVQGLRVTAETGLYKATPLLAEKIAVTSAAKVAVLAGGANEGVSVLAVHEARDVLTATTRGALSSNPSLFDQPEMAPLFRKYPELKAVVRENQDVDEFLKRNPGFLQDASIRLYQQDPAMFAAKFEEQRLLGLRPSAFDSVLKEQVAAQNQDDLYQFSNRVKKHLQKDGYTTEVLSKMGDDERRAVVEKYLQQELTVKPPNQYKWSYKSGSLTVSGKLGNLDFEQAISVEWMAKATLVTTAVVKGKRVLWDKSEFRKDNRCAVKYLCVEEATAPEAASEKTAIPLQRALKP